jgi:hypothetical protein
MHPKEISRDLINRRLSNGEVKTYEQLHPTMEEGCLLDHRHWVNVPANLQTALYRAQSQSFAPFKGTPARLETNEAM